MTDNTMVEHKESKERALSLFTTERLEDYAAIVMSAITIIVVLILK